MPKLVRNVFAVLAGVIVGSSVNMALIAIGPSLIPHPPGVEVSNAEGLSKAMQLFEPRHFVMPFLAHALGTLVGALVAYLVAANRKAAFGYVIGAFFLSGGVAACFLIPAPLWFMALDLLVAYLPMAWLGIWIGTRLQQTKAAP